MACACGSNSFERIGAAQCGPIRCTVCGREYSREEMKAHREMKINAKKEQEEQIMVAKADINKDIFEIEQGQEESYENNPLPQSIDVELREEFKRLYAAVVMVLEAFDQAFYGGNATINDAHPFISPQSINEVGKPIHEALACLRGESKEAHKKRTTSKTAKLDGGK